MEKIQTIEPKDSFEMQISSLKPKTPKQIITSYKPILFFLDFVTLLFSFFLTILIFEPHRLFHYLGSLMPVFLTFTIVYLSQFWAFGLYSYNGIYIWKNHYKKLKKGLAWCLISMALFVLLVFTDDRLSELSVILFVVGCSYFLLLISKSENAFLNNVVRSLVVVLLSIIVPRLTGEASHSIFRSHDSFIPLFFTISSVLIVIDRYFVVSFVFNGWMRKIFRWSIVIIGSNESAKSVADFIVQNDAPYYIKGFINPDAHCSLNCVVPKPHLGEINQLPEIASKTEIDDIVITDTDIDKDLLLKVMDYCFSQGLNVWFSPKVSAIFELKFKTKDLGGMPMIKLCTQKRSWLFDKLKYGLDALIALPLSIILLPVYFIISLAIKLNSEGPVFYKAIMIGKSRQIFKMYKFRTMFFGSDSKIHEDYVTKLINGEIGQKGRDGQRLKIINDPRITSVGKYLRRFSLDELPQLINVMKGQMSLVGPRPCTTYEFTHYKEWHKKRVVVRPGITGIWQVSGRSEVAFEDMILLDLYYVYNRSILLDLQILYETIFTVLKQKGAY
jgi:exopolysaccharide biosynthesis polyprenyl glycosylphosphotransferase